MITGGRRSGGPWRRDADASPECVWIHNLAVRDEACNIEEGGGLGWGGAHVLGGHGGWTFSFGMM